MTRIMPSGSKCEHCGLSVSGGLPHDDANDCISALKGRLHFSEKAYKSKVRENGRLLEKIERLEKDTLRGGLFNRIKELESGHEAMKLELNRVLNRLNFMIGDVNSTSECQDARVGISA